MWSQHQMIPSGSSGRLLVMKMIVKAAVVIIMWPHHFSSQRWCPSCFASSAFELNCLFDDESWRLMLVCSSLYEVCSLCIYILFGVWCHHEGTSGIEWIQLAFYSVVSHSLAEICYLFYLIGTMQFNIFLMQSIELMYCTEKNTANTNTPLRFWAQLAKMFWFDFSQHLSFAANDFISGTDLILTKCPRVYSLHGESWLSKFRFMMRYFAWIWPERGSGARLFEN